VTHPTNFTSGTPEGRGANDGMGSVDPAPRRYRTIVADPPWDHSDGTGYTLGNKQRLTASKKPRSSGADPRSTGLPYGTMDLEAVKALPVADWAEDDAHLYLWTTNRYLRDVWDVAEAWGFKGVCVIVWCKSWLGGLGGGAWQSNVEFCLFARRGNLPTLGKVRGRWYEWPRRVGPPVGPGEKRGFMHSAKPEAFLDHVEQVSPGPYLEMFARRARMGWEYWGDQSLSTAEVAA
jgi:N6-adenosine-specific RNA methylase IME4